MPVTSLECPTEGCAGTVGVAYARRDGGGAIVQYLDDMPGVVCSQGCRTPYELVEPVNEILDRIVR